MKSPNVSLFTWHELLTPDTEAAKAFYGEVVGWRTQAWADPAMAYMLWLNHNGPAGGLIAVPAASPARWLGTVSVEDIEATVALATKLGGIVQEPIHAVPNVGRFAVIADPTGASFSVMQRSDPGPPLDLRELGRFSWNELWTSDPEAAWGFYAAIFGWVETGSMEMAPGVRYRMFGRDKDTSIGGIAQKAPEGPASAWLYYATVPDADAACAKAKALGAHIFLPPIDVPGGGRAAGGVDPSGAGFAVFSAPG